ncbi:MAG: glycosyltransferase family 1 protein [Aquihabitans sp.]
MRRSSSRRLRLVIDGKPLIDDHFSGVGHYTMSLLQAFDDLLDDEPDLDVRIAVPVKRVAKLGQYRFRNIRPLAIPTTLSLFRRAMVAGRLPKMDLILGRAIYFFPDFVRWPLARSRSITAVHDLCFEKVPHMVDEANGQFLRREVRKSVERSDLITALTFTMADEIAEQYGVARGKVEVVGCAADTRHFYRRSDREVAEVKDRYGIFGDYVIAVGNIEPRKNQTKLIDAFCDLPADLADQVTLVLVGAGAWKEGEIRERIDQALATGHKVRLLLGQVSDADLPALYTGARASAYVSVYEGFGMPPLESMACRTPVVASNVSVIPEVVGQAAVLVDPHDLGSMTSGLEHVLRLSDEDRDDLVQQGLANVGRYRWDDAARSLLAAVRAQGGR